LQYRFTLVLNLLFLLASNAIVAAEYGTGNKSPEARQRPNVLMIVADDLGVNDTGFSGGNAEVITPNIDQLSRESVVFSRHYTAGDVCAPTRASLMTGLYPQRLNFRIGHRGIPEDIITLPDLFRGQGYSTHHIGKWHLGHTVEAARVKAQGYDDFYGFLHQYFLKGPAGEGPPPGSTYNDPYLSRDSQPPQKRTGHLTDILTTEAVKVIQGSANSDPWLLTLWYFAPHGPLQPPARWMDRYGTLTDMAMARYYALVSTLDENVGRLLSTLKDSGQEDNTIVVFLSDNGGDEGAAPSNDPYFGTKNQFYEGGVITPMLIRNPGKWPHKVVNEVVSSLDLYPTLAASADIRLDHAVDGRDLTPLINGNPIQQQYWFWEAYRLNNKGIDEGLEFDFSVLNPDGSWRLVQQDGERKLFDLRSDPTGSVDVITSHPQELATLLDQYRQWHESTSRIPFDMETINAAKWTGNTLEIPDPTSAGVIRNQALQRSPGRAGFSFAAGIARNGVPATKLAADEIIAQQEGAWSLLLRQSGRIELHIAGEQLDADIDSDSACNAVVANAYFRRPMLKPESAQTHVDLYVNGILKAQAHSKLMIPDEVSDKPTWIGNGANLQQGFVGSIHEPRLFNVRLPQEEVTALNSTLCPDQ
jgi:arylsulfatase A-like enzyme